MSVLIGIALKSLLIAGLTLGLLQLMKSRSAAERSWVAHIGLFALVLMAFAPLVLPSWNIETPSLFNSAAEPAATVPAPAAAPVVATNPAVTTTAAKSIAPVASSTLPSLNPVAAAMALYALPAAILLLITFLALARLIALQARADVLVDGHWLSALARAQRRMGFKHGTALLTSNELASPISWGVIRPVILLNSRAVEAADEAEAIIAHELAHVARLDWVKLLLARVATALFWFNPLVWLLAREAHQLREETADDTVLAANIVDTDYAQLLVGVARHECPGLLLGAHGVAPSKSSLARRVARVLDGKSIRGPVARPFALGVFVGAVLVAAPLAALTLTPATPKAPRLALARTVAGHPIAPYYPETPVTPEAPTDLGHIIATGVSTGVNTAVAAATAIAPTVAQQDEGNFRVESPNGSTVEGKNGVIVARSPSGATSTIYPPDKDGRRKIVAVAPNGARSVTYSYDRSQRHNPEIDRIIEMKAVGVTPEYIGQMRAAVPRLNGLQFADFTGMKAVGVTPDFARSLVAAGFPSITAEELTEARAVGLTGDYVRAMRSAGVSGDLDDFVQLRAVGVDPAFAARVRASGIKNISADDLVEMRALGGARPPLPPHAPAPPRVKVEVDPGG
ncbi:MAG: M56 family metallopeptidase [Sphingomonas sp.]|nr:M56 family metallopeptidase [Sphingomonas sp.]